VLARGAAVCGNAIRNAPDLRLNSSEALAALYLTVRQAASARPEKPRQSSNNDVEQQEHLMLKIIACVLLAAWTLTSFGAGAEPVNLKLSFFSSDRSTSYRAALKPFVEGIKSEGRDFVGLELFISGALEKNLMLQPQLVAEGRADIAYVVPGMTRELFPDNSIIEMPGLYQDMHEATLVFTRLLAAGKLKGYEDYFVIGAYVTDPEAIHARTPISSLEELKGKKVRVNNAGQAAALDKLGAIPVLMQVNQISDALSSGRIDAALVPPSPLTDFGIKRVATYHYMLGTCGAPLLVLMNRKKFESLPQASQQLIRKFSGEWAAKQFIAVFEEVDKQVIQQLKSEPERRVITPTQRELSVARAVFKSVVDEWSGRSSYNRTQLSAAEAEIGKLRATR